MTDGEEDGEGRPAEVGTQGHPQGREAHVDRTTDEAEVNHVNWATVLVAVLIVLLLLCFFGDPGWHGG